MGGIRLGRLEHAVLSSVGWLGGRGYGVTIADKVEQIAKSPVTLGAIYATLDRLERKGFVSSRLGEATPQRGGKPKRYY